MKLTGVLRWESNLGLFPEVRVPNVQLPRINAVLFINYMFLQKMLDELVTVKQD